MLKSNILALAILAVSSVCLAGPPSVSEPLKPRSGDVTASSVMRGSVAESVGLRAALKKSALPETLAEKVASVGVTWDAKAVESIATMTREQQDVFNVTTMNALATIETGRGALSEEGALIVAAAYRALELAPTTFSKKFQDVTSKLKVDLKNSTSLSNGVLAGEQIRTIESALGTTLTQFIDCK